MLFNQTIQLIELTKELERIPVDTLTSMGLYLVVLIYLIKSAL